MRRIVLHIGRQAKRESTALAAFSSGVVPLTPFTRDAATLLSALEELRPGSATGLEAVLAAASQHVQAEWGAATPCQVSHSDGEDAKKTHEKS